MVLDEKGKSRQPIKDLNVEILQNLIQNVMKLKVSVADI